MIYPSTQLEDVGIVSYAWTRGVFFNTAVIGSDPLCSPDNLEKLIRAFHRDVHGRHLYLSMSKECADVLHGKLGFKKTQCAKDYYCDLDVWKPSGKRLRR